VRLDRSLMLDRSHINYVILTTILRKLNKLPLELINIIYLKLDIALLLYSAGPISKHDR
jgi:hypothetical protein